MPVLEFGPFAELARSGGVIAGLDLGTKTIGVAVADRGLVLAHPRPVINRTKFSADVSLLLEVFAREGVAGVVIGHPVNMDGSDSARAQSARAFARNFERFSVVPFLLWDERLSTVAAERSLIEMDVSRSKRAQRIDSAAAAFILQGVLDRLRQSR
jgi:putative holliday junction resolvase